MAEPRQIGLALAGAAVLATLGFAVAGCGGGSSAAPSTTTTTTTTGTGTGGGGAGGGRTLPAAFRAYQSCLAAHGVKLPSFRPGARGRPTGTTRTFTFTGRTGTTRRPPGGFGRFGANLTAKQRAALQACRSKLPAGGFGALGGRGRRGPGGRGGAPASGAFAKYTKCLASHGVKFGASQSGPTFRKAEAACRSLLAPPSAPKTTTSS